MTPEQVIRQHHLLSVLGPDEARDLLERASVRTCRSGETLFHRGEPGDGIYGVLAGRIVVSVDSEAGRELIWARIQDGDGAGGAEQMERAYTGLLEAKQRAYLTYLGTLVAGAKLELNQFEEALSILAQVEALSIETHQQMFISDLHRLRGDALRRLDPKNARIGACYDSALSLAAQQGAPALADRARRSREQWLAEN